ncbi:MAG: nuclear transport factor 2 family protein [Proteobacteria bacterium]|nr:nuclear transport factor 2 family protein [Pseudomonadota bacterium]
MLREKSQKLIEEFYKHFNAKDLDKMYAMLSDNVQHEMNDGGMQKGKAAFVKMIQDSTKNYQENVDNVIYMVSDDGKHVATKFTFKGKYISTDESNIPAKGQSYQANAINYFDIENGKIVTAMCWYNHQDWIKQVSK